MRFAIVGLQQPIDINFTALSESRRRAGICGLPLREHALAHFLRCFGAIDSQRARFR